MESNKNIPNINFRSTGILLVVNMWLYIHLINVSITCSYYDIIPLIYHFCCTVWMIQTHKIYYWLKHHKPKWTKPFLKIFKYEFISKVWRNLSVVNESRRREDNITKNTTELHNGNNRVITISNNNSEKNTDNANSQMVAFLLLLYAIFQLPSWDLLATTVLIFITFICYPAHHHFYHHYEVLSPFIISSFTKVRNNLGFDGSSNNVHHVEGKREQAIDNSWVMLLFSLQVIFEVPNRDFLITVVLTSYILYCLMQSHFYYHYYQEFSSIVTPRSGSSFVTINYRDNNSSHGFLTKMLRCIQ